MQVMDANELQDKLDEVLASFERKPARILVTKNGAPCCYFEAVTSEEQQPKVKRRPSSERKGK